MAETLGDYLGGQAKEVKATRETQGLNPGTISSYFVFGNYTFKVRVTKVLIEQQSIGGDGLIWGNTTFGIWNSFNWKDPAAATGIFGTAIFGTATFGKGTSFILGNSNFGILGTGTLGGDIGSYSTIETVTLDQTIPTIAREIIADWLVGSSRDEPEIMNLGTASTSYSDTDTALYSEIGRKTVTYDIDESKKVEYQIEILSTDTTFQSDTFREVGLISTSQELYTRAIISPLTMSGALNTRITITHELSDDSIGDATMCTGGMNEIRDFLGGGSATGITNAAIGTGTDAISENDTVLANQITIPVVASATTSDDTSVFQSIFSKSVAAGSDITRSGLYNGATGTDLFCQTKFGAINKSELFQIYQTDRIKIV